jgi:uncharacterized protein (UPF0147 family)
LNKKNPDNQIQSLVRDLSNPDLYKRKQAAWMIARLAQKGKSTYIIQAGAIPMLAKCLEDREMIVKYRAVWALGMLAKHGQDRAVRESNVQIVLKNMVSDKTEVEICHARSGEMIGTTLGRLAEEALKYIGG